MAGARYRVTTKTGGVYIVDLAERTIECVVSAKGYTFGPRRFAEGEPLCRPRVGDRLLAAFAEPDEEDNDFMRTSTVVCVQELGIAAT